MNRKTWNFWKNPFGYCALNDSEYLHFCEILGQKKTAMLHIVKLLEEILLRFGLDWNLMLNCKDKDLPNFLFTKRKIWLQKTNLRIIGKIEQNGSTMKTMKEI